MSLSWKSMTMFGYISNTPNSTHLSNLTRSSFIQNKYKYVVGAHRGGCRESLENTLPAFKTAVANGTDFIELDLHLTKDKQVVVCHDNALKRITGVDANISDLNYADLPKFQNRIELHFANGRYYFKQEGDAECLTLFEDVLKECNGIPINIDFKQGEYDVIEATHEVLFSFRLNCFFSNYHTFFAFSCNKYNYTDKVTWGSFDQITSLKCRTVNPNIARFASKEEFKSVVFLYFVGLLPFVNINFQSFQIPYPNEEYISSCISESSRYKNTRLSRIGYKIMKFVSPAMISHLDKRNIQTILWVINNDDNLADLNKYKVHGIMTDEPSKIIPKVQAL